MSEARWSVILLAFLIFAGVTVIFGGMLKDYVVAAGLGGFGALAFAAIAIFMASDGEVGGKRSKRK